MRKKYFIETFGCQMNKNDSNHMAESLMLSGFDEADSILDAEIVVFNTCSVRQHAEDRVIARIKTNRNDIKKNNGITIITGCMAQRIGKSLVDKKLADIVIGPYQSPIIGDIIKIYLTESRNIFLSQNEKNFQGRINHAPRQDKNTNSWHKWVTITHGCENYCSYCIVPYVRGKLISFKSESIVNYIRILVSNGIKEITLLGQNVNQYGNDNGDLPFYRLLDNIAKIDGLYRINFITSHPGDFPDELIYVIKDNSNISKSIHIPLQSGSDKILKMMNRQYEMKHYLKIIEKIKSELTDYSITTDLIVGFPGETVQDFEDTLKFIKLIEFDDAFMYAYSPREGTPAFTKEDKLTRNEKNSRLNRLIYIQKNISKNKLSARINSTEKIIVEKISKKSSSEVMGKTFLNHPVVLPGSRNDIGKNLLIKINSLKGATLQGIRIV